MKHCFSLIRCLFNTTKSTLPLVRTAVDRFLLSLQDSSLRNMPFPEVGSILAFSVVSLAGPDVPREGTSGHSCQHSVDDAKMLA